MLKRTVKCPYLWTKRGVKI